MGPPWISGGIPVLLASLLPACGAGTAAVLSGSDDSGGGTAPMLESFEVASPRSSPSLLVLDASQPMRVALYFDLGLGAGEQALTRLDGITGNEVDLPAGELALSWDFTAELGAGLHEDVRLTARLGGGLLSGGELALDLGNDAPVVRSLEHIDLDPVAGEAVGTTGIELLVDDSSADVVSLRIEFDVQGDAPDAGWQLARPGLLDGGLPTPDFGVADVRVAREEDGSTRVPFFWATDAPTDLHDLEREVQLRFTAFDGLLESAPLLSGVLRVDNNQVPTVQLQNDLVVTNPDERRGIPVPFRVLDDEEDPVEVILQWRRPGQDFPELRADELDAILADPELRRAHQVCTPLPRFARGRVLAAEADAVRLPELALAESWILPAGLAGRTLELLRPSALPTPITPSWSASPLAAPVAALPLGDGLTALVLDVPGAARLREIELASGAVVREIAPLGAGLPSALALEAAPGGGTTTPAAALVALHDAAGWRVLRVELASGQTSELAVSDGSQPAPVRGLASLGAHAAVLTVGSTLQHLDYRGPPRLATLRSGLAGPHGVIVDPLASGGLYVAERDADRVLALALQTHAALPVAVSVASLPVARPEALALEDAGTRLLVVTGLPGGGSQLVGLELGARGGNQTFPIGAPQATELSALATGADGLRLAADPQAGELLLGGGVEQRRRITDDQPGVGQRVTVEAPFQPPARAGQVWRISSDPGRVPGSGEGLATFLWNSGADCPAGGPVFLRAEARDAELGLPSDGAAPKSLRAELDGARATLGGSGVTDTPVSVVTADLDADGDLDVASANALGDDLTVFFQTTPGLFAPAPLVVGGFPQMGAPQDLVAADLDGDGDLDLASANSFGDDLTIFFQQAPGSFASAPLVLGGPTRLRDPMSLLAADLDQDGDLDLACVNEVTLTLAIFFQEAPGDFADVPLSLSTGQRPSGLASADLDGDGDLDLAFGGGERVWIVLQTSPGGFGPPVDVGGVPAPSLLYELLAADLDGDGDADLATTSWDSSGPVNRGNLAVFLQTAPASFEAPVVVGGSVELLEPSGLLAADLDGDGDADLGTSNAASGNLTIFFQEAPGAFAAEPLVLSPSSPFFPADLVGGDLDGDGDLDLAAPSGDQLTLLFQEATPTYAGSPLVLGDPQTTSEPHHVTAADLDADGDLDLACDDGDDVLVFFQQTPGNFPSLPLTVAAGGGYGVGAADLDGDADLDLFSVDPFESEVMVSFHRSPGHFPGPPLALGGAAITDEPRCVAAGDLDADGDLDLVAGNEQGRTLTVFFQQAPGAFASAPLVLGGPPATDVPTAIIATDLDGDGDIDLACSDLVAGNVVVFLQDAPGSFAGPPLSLGRGKRDLTAGDLDGDGDLDLAAANGTDHDLTVFLQDSPGVFASPFTLGGLATTLAPWGVVAVDLDGDGDAELASANLDGHDLTVFFQESPARFGAVPLRLGGVGTTDGPWSLVAADLDGDGEPDLASANHGGQDLTVLWGGR
ncbi:MAG TPA: FG-GAP-like repeat-containing protein [Planctomycetota bacterium]